MVGWFSIYLRYSLLPRVFLSPLVSDTTGKLSLSGVWSIGFDGGNIFKEGLRNLELSFPSPFPTTISGIGIAPDLLSCTARTSPGMSLADFGFLRKAKGEIFCRRD